MYLVKRIPFFVVVFVGGGGVFFTYRDGAHDVSFKLPVSARGRMTTCDPTRRSFIIESQSLEVNSEVTDPQSLEVSSAITNVTDRHTLRLITVGKCFTRNVCNSNTLDEGEGWARRKE